MNFELSDDQTLLMTAFEALLDGYRAPPPGKHGYVVYSAPLQEEIAAAGFAGITGEPGFGPLEAAMLIEAAARCPVSVELAASTLILPLVGERAGPVALAWGYGRPSRYLEQAATVCVFERDDVLVGTPAPGDIEALKSVVAYPLATLRQAPDDATRYSGEQAAAIRRRARISIAAEGAGLMRAALDLTVGYVKDRHQFGQSLGNFQAIQHRLAESAQLVHACRLLAFRAAYDDDERSAALACLYAQEAIRKINYDCHQFSGAIGLTLEYPLHLWTYRLKFLQGEAGGWNTQAQVLAEDKWPASFGRAVAGCTPRLTAVVCSTR
jgi:Acyl-CoA dehydrogenase, C-terminal domain